MKVLFAVSTEDVADKIIKTYQREYKEIISSKNVFYFNAIIKELQRNQSYDRIVISEDLEPFTNNNYDAIDKFIFEKLDSISDEAIDKEGRDIPIVVICSERREKSDSLLVKLFSIGVYDALIGDDRSIENVCNLLNKPRTKKEAKLYYKIEQGEYEDEGNVSELEIQNILSHYRRLGKNEDRYVESFDSIVEQYNDDQLKIIIKFLPIEVKAVLEARSEKYQSIMTYSTNTIKKEETKKSNLNVSKIVDSHSKKILGPVIIPSALRKNNEVKKIVDETTDNSANEILEEIENIEGVSSAETVSPLELKVDEIENINSSFEELEDNNSSFEEIEEKQDLNEQPVRRGRGRPKKILTPEEIEAANAPKRGRGRPRKNPIQDIDVEELSTENAGVLPGFEDVDIEAIPNISDEDEISSLPGLQDEADSILSDLNERAEEVDEVSVLPGFEENDEDSEVLDIEEDANAESTKDKIVSELPELDEEEFMDDEDSDMYNDINYNLSSKKQLKEVEEKEVDISYLLTQDKKIVSFVGTSKNGVSFLVNNIAEILSNNGIKTAIVDLTKNKNSYYIYTENREELREIAYASMENLKQGNAIGIDVNKNLTVYTSSPNIRNTEYSIENMLTTLVKNYSLVLLDCDYSTNKEYFRVAQEIYMVQSMDVLTIQPLTEFLRRLKLKNILQPEKLRAVINKAQKVRGLNEEMIVGGMSTYNDPEMSIQDRLFDMKTISKSVIPFDMDAYSIYLSGIANCEISTRGYNKVFVNCLNSLADQVYPLVSGGRNRRKGLINNRVNKDYEQNVTRFSNDMSNTLNEMKKQYK